MARAHVRPEPQATGSVTPYEDEHVIRRLPPDVEARMHELAGRHSDGLLSMEERLEFDRLTQQALELMLTNARALLRHRDPAAYEATVAQEHGGHRPTQPQQPAAAPRRA